MSNPIIVPRVGDGKIFGFNIFGISSSRAPRGELELELEQVVQIKL